MLTPSSMQRRCSASWRRSPTRRRMGTGYAYGVTVGDVGSCAATLRPRLELDPGALCLFRGHARDVLFRQPHCGDEAGQEPATDGLGLGPALGLRDDSSPDDGPESVLGHA